MTGARFRKLEQAVCCLPLQILLLALPTLLFCDCSASSGLQLSGYFYFPWQFHFRAYFLLSYTLSIAQGCDLSLDVSVSRLPYDYPRMLFGLVQNELNGGLVSGWTVGRYCARYHATSGTVRCLDQHFLYRHYLEKQEEEGGLGLM